MVVARRRFVAAVAALLTSAFGISGAQAQVRLPTDPPILSTDTHNRCGWGLGGAAAGVGLAALLAPSAAPGPVNWSGLYAGGHLGCAWGDTDWRFANATAFSNAGGRSTFDNSGMIAGGQIGYNWQSGKWVFGLEASLSGGDLSAEKINALNPNPALVSTRLVSDLRWLIQLTPRIGYAFAPHWHGYVKGGFASAEFDATLIGATATTSSSTALNSRHTGWTLGAGVEYRLAHNLILGLDYSYITLDGNSRTAPCGAPCNVAPILAVDPDGIHMLTGRIGFKIGQ